VSRRFRLILLGVVIGAVALAVYFLLISPMRGDISDLQSQIDEVDSLIETAQREVDNAAEIQKQGRENEARLIELSKMMPDTSEIPSLILQVQDLADKSGIEWIQVSPGTPGGSEGLEFLTLPLSLTFSGNFYDVSDFVYRAEQMVAGPGRLLTVKDLSLSPGTASGSGSPVLNVQMTLLAFVMATAEEAPAEESADATTTTESTGSSESSETTESTE
jgi:Tfp pilus assembly protein PilO